MSVQNLNKKPGCKTDNPLRMKFIVDNDTRGFFKSDELIGILNHLDYSQQKSDSTNPQKNNKEAGSQSAEITSDFSHFCMYYDLPEFCDIPVDWDEEETDEHASKSAKKPTNWRNRKGTPIEYAGSLAILSSVLVVIETKNNIRRYFKGEITPNELVANVNEKAIHYIHRLINRVLNYRCKNTRYYISLPVDMFFSTAEDDNGFILACKLDESFEDLEMSNLIGPADFKYGTYVISKYLEIDGDFSQIPSGTRLAKYDYLQIIRRYPNIIEHISHLMKARCVKCANKNNDEMLQLASEQLQRYLKYYPKPNEEPSKSEKKPEGITVLSQETIDSITFVQPVEWVTLEEVKNGTFGSFEELLLRTNNSQRHQIEDEETPKVLKLTPPKP